MPLVQRTPRKPRYRFDPIGYTRRAVSKAMKRSMKLIPRIRRREAATQSEANADVGTSAAAGGSVSSESVEILAPSPSRSLISHGLLRVSSPSTTRDLGTRLMLRGGGSSAFAHNDVPLRENENDSGEPSESRESLLTSWGELSDLAHRMDRISLGADVDTRPALPPSIEPLYRIGLTGVDPIDRRWIDAPGASQTQVSHQRQAFSEWRDSTTNYDDDDDYDGDVKRADDADEMQVLSDQLSRTNFGSDHFVVIDRDVSSEDGETTDSDLTSMDDSESESDESEDSNDSDDGSDNHDSHNNHDTPNSPDNQDTDDEAYENCFQGSEHEEDEDDEDAEGAEDDEWDEDDEDDDDDEGDERDKNHQNEEKIGADMYKMFYLGVAHLFTTLGSS